MRIFPPLSLKTRKEIHADSSSLSFCYYTTWSQHLSIYMTIHFTCGRFKLNLWSHHPCQLNRQQTSTTFPQSHRAPLSQTPVFHTTNVKDRDKGHCTKQGGLLLQLRRKDTEHCSLNNRFHSISEMYPNSLLSLENGKPKTTMKTKGICIITFVISALLSPDVTSSLE